METVIAIIYVLVWIIWALRLEVAVHGLPESAPGKVAVTHSPLFTTHLEQGHVLWIRCACLPALCYCMDNTATCMQWLSCSLFGTARNGATATFAKLWHGAHCPELVKIAEAIHPQPYNYIQIHSTHP